MPVTRIGSSANLKTTADAPTSTARRASVRFGRRPMTATRNQHQKPEDGDAPGITNRDQRTVGRVQRSSPIMPPGNEPGILRQAMSPVLVTGGKWGTGYAFGVDGVKRSVPCVWNWRMSAAPHPQRKEKTLFSYTEAGRKPGFFVFPLQTKSVV